jgi:HSP20 family protein
MSALTLAKQLDLPTWDIAPFSMLRRMEREMDRMFGGTGGDYFAPPLEVERKNGAFVVKAEIPGMKMEDIKVELSDEGLVIEGERKHEAKVEKEGYFRTERSYGKFHRMVTLPEGAKTEEAKATYNNGVLEVTIPVPETKKAALKRIPVKTA